MSLSRATMYWAVFLLRPSDEDELWCWHPTGDSARLQAARLLVEHPDTWKPGVEVEVRPILSTEMENFIPGTQVAA